jgi:hypothetical protein
VAIGSRLEVEVRCPWPRGGCIDLVSGITTWCAQALKQERVLLFVGPPVPWKRGVDNLSRLLGTLASRSACAGVVPARMA